MAFHQEKRSKTSVHQRMGGTRRLWSTLSGILRFERFETRKNRKTVEKVPGIKGKEKRFRRLTTTFCVFSLDSTPHAIMPSSQPLRPLLQTIQQPSCYKTLRQGLGHTSELLFTTLLGSLTFKPFSFKCLNSIRLTSCPGLKFVPEGQDASFGN